MANETYVLLNYLHRQAYCAPPMGLKGRQFLEGGGWEIEGAFFQGGRL